MKSYNYTKVHNALNEKIDYEKLDEMAKNNSMANERQFSEMVNCLRVASKFFSFVNEDKISFICDRLQKSGYGVSECSKAFECLPDRFDKFPPYKDLISIVKSFRSEPIKEDLSDSVAEDHRNKYLALKEMFLTKYDQERLTKFTQYWLQSNYDIDSDLVSSFLSVSMFEMPALFDWHDCFYNISKDAMKKIAMKKEQFRLNNEKSYIRTNAQYPEINTNNEWKQYLK